MSSSILEQIRLNHEFAEAIESAICDELDQKPSGQKAKTWQQHRVAKLLDALQSYSHQLTAQYADVDGSFKDGLSSIRGPNMFTSFYESVNATREYHQRFPGVVTNDPVKAVGEVEVSFSGEEIFGKYLDLHLYFVRYCNLPGVPASDQDYLQYLDKFNSFFFIAESCKHNKAYLSYVHDLYSYLHDFLRRIQPLVDTTAYEKEWLEQFKKKWAQGAIQGWVLKPRPSPTSSNALRLGMFNDKSELEALGADRLKEALVALGLKCGGTVKERAERLWLVRGKPAADFPAHVLAKKRKAGEGDTTAPTATATAAGGAAEGESIEDPREKIAWAEYRVSSICDLMMEIVSSTRRHAVKQQSRTAEEKEAEIEEEEYGFLPDIEVTETKRPDEDEDGPLYNPLNIPLGWDGKPIPYWMYKLHGLGNEFKCEICGNQSYWGRRAFDKHFQEWRHAHGMRCLGIPNTKHFHDITRVADVQALYVKIKSSLVTEQFVGDMHEEFEDSQGNVLNRRTYEDLARQGLL